jgi:hypothetical protein
LPAGLLQLLYTLGTMVLGALCYASFPLATAWQVRLGV